jgi:hypothetical protein
MQNLIDPVIILAVVLANHLRQTTQPNTASTGTGNKGLMTDLSLKKSQN